MIANKLKYDTEYPDNRYYNNLVFMYDIDLFGNNPIIYSSINKTLKSLSISYGTLMDYIINQYIFKDKFVLSFEPLSSEDLTVYYSKPVGDNQLRKHITLLNEEFEPILSLSPLEKWAVILRLTVKSLVLLLLKVFIKVLLL